MVKIKIKQVIFIAIATFAAVAIMVFLMASELQPGSPLIIKISHGKTLPGAIEYARVSIINNSDKTFTHVVVDMGPAGKEVIDELPPGQTYFASPKTMGGVSEIKVTTDQGITVTKRI